MVEPLPAVEPPVVSTTIWVVFVPVLFRLSLTTRVMVNVPASLGVQLSDEALTEVQPVGSAVQLKLNHGVPPETEPEITVSFPSMI